MRSSAVVDTMAYEVSPYQLQRWDRWDMEGFTSFSRFSVVWLPSFILKNRSNVCLQPIRKVVVMVK